MATLAQALRAAVSLFKSEPKPSNMVGHRVHIIEADLSGGDIVGKRDALGRDIARLAAHVNEPVFFHDYKDDGDPKGGAPIILLECSDAFLAKVRKLPSFMKQRDERSGLTERKPSIQSYFSAAPGAPASPSP